MKRMAFPYVYSKTFLILKPLNETKDNIERVIIHNYVNTAFVFYRFFYFYFETKQAQGHLHTRTRKKTQPRRQGSGPTKAGRVF
jgi:hypothetical protein